MSKEALNLTFTTFLFILFTLAMVEALTFSKLAQFFPLYISVAGSVLTLIYLVIELVAFYRKRVTEEKQTNISFIKPVLYIGWILLYLTLIYVSGLLVATAIFLTVFLKKESKLTNIQTGISVIVVLIGISVLSSALNIYWPSNLLNL